MYVKSVESTLEQEADANLLAQALASGLIQDKRSYRPHPVLTFTYNTRPET